MTPRWIIGILIAIIFWGLIGMYASSNIGVDCTVPFGPLCFAWQKNTLGQIQELYGEMEAKYGKPAETMPVVNQELCDSLVPEIIVIKENETQTPFKAEWGLNATTIRAIDWCQKGKGIGQNINNYYCNANVQRKIYDVNAQGIVINDTVEKYEIKLVANSDFKVVSYDCNRI